MNIHSHEYEAKILSRLAGLGIPELKSVRHLNELPGNYVNLECTLPNGCKGKILDDAKTYLVAQIEIPGSERCYGIAADEREIAVYQYGCNGTDAILVLWCVI